MTLDITKKRDILLSKLDMMESARYDIEIQQRMIQKKALSGEDHKEQLKQIEDALEMADDQIKLVEELIDEL